MEDLSDFVASVIEFLVGGLLFTISILLLVSSLVEPPSFSPSLVSVMSVYSGLISIAVVALIYAMGVVGESVARSIFEIELDRATVRDPSFRVAGPEHSKGAHRFFLTRVHEKLTLILLRLPYVWGGSEAYTIAERDAARKERERQRAVVMTWHVSAQNEVQGQLKRLRLERIFALSTGITTLALALRGNWRAAFIALSASAVLTWLVMGRFRRYCGAISRGYEWIVEERMHQTSNQMQTGALTISAQE